MTLANGTGGYQVGSGNNSEVILSYSAAPLTAGATATLTAAQVTGKVLVADPSTSAATYTLPTAADLDEAVPSARVGSTFDLSIVNLGTSSGAVTLALGTGITNGGNALVAVAVTSSATFRFRKTGTDAWVVYKIA